MSEIISKQHIEIIDLVTSIVGTKGEIYFNSPVEFKVSPHFPAVTLWAVAVSPDNNIWLRDSNGEWWKLQTTDVNYDSIIGSLYQRCQIELAPYKK